jgi:hypothetical protein
MRRGQAALEFLMTYGWALLMILVAIGAFVYFGVVRGDDKLPSRCTFGPEVICKESWVNSSGELRFKFKNNMGANTDFTFNATFIGGGTDQEVACTPTPGVPDGEEAEVVYSGFTGFDVFSGSKVKFEITSYYIKANTQYNKLLMGEIYDTVR